MTRTFFSIGLGIIITGLWWLMFFPHQVLARPWFTISGSNYLNQGYENSYGLYLNTDGETVTAVQAIIHYDKNKVEPVSLSARGSRCSFWAPADPSIGYGSSVAPYIYNEEVIVVSCGFANPGYNTGSGTGDLIVIFSFTTAGTEDSESEFTISDTMYRYIGSVLAPGTSVGLPLHIFVVPVTPTIAPSPTPIYTQTITAESLNLRILSRQSGTGTRRARPTSAPLPTVAAAPLVEMDDSIPEPPVLTPRPTYTPRIEPTMIPEDIGDVLAINSFKELFIPGSSNADRTVVMINLISTAGFLVILTILLWRLFLTAKTNKLKFKRMQQLIDGEMSVILGKNVLPNEQDKEDLMHKINEINKEKTG